MKRKALFITVLMILLSSATSYASDAQMNADKFGIWTLIPP
ncbi:hypothetical protein [Serpentinicella alkaliphila]|uniref:Uncharacterized protein n=1 Tax=Serpentinicella alkaliphila TaxID=1734049 RepID=A0A4R2THJ2_9FIRM|nr:hypothetical protein EDD79_101113 [Serpentinicella alkaliphila]